MILTLMNVGASLAEMEVLAKMFKAHIFVIAALDGQAIHVKLVQILILY